MKQSSTPIRVISVVSNDIVTDNRVHKIASSLMNQGFEVMVLGREYKNSPLLQPRSYQTKRFRLLFNKGPLFYANLNFRQFFFLIRTPFNIVLSNDLDTLWACFLAAWIKNKKVVFDSHELFSEVPELVNRRIVRSIWRMLEKILVTRIKFGITVCSSIANYYAEKYQVSFEIIRNTNLYQPPFAKSSSSLKKIIIYQGSVNIGRGLELAIKSMKYLDNYELWIIGGGDIVDELKILTESQNLTEKVKFVGRIPIEELSDYTRKASIGISLEENLGLNYRYALPNKLFDYVQSRIPVIVSDLPEMKSIVDEYKIGKILLNRTPQALAGLIDSTVDELKGESFEIMIQKAAEELSWEKEEEKLIQLFKRVRT